MDCTKRANKRGDEHWSKRARLIRTSAEQAGHREAKATHIPQLGLTISNEQSFTPFHILLPINPVILLLPTFEELFGVAGGSHLLETFLAIPKEIFHVIFDFGILLQHADDCPTRKMKSIIRQVRTGRAGEN